MKNNKKSQISAEYLILFGFVAFAAMVVLMIGYFYSGMAQDKIILAQSQTMAEKIISSAEMVFYSGNPSQAQITIYVPSQIKSIEITDYDLILEISTRSGIVKRAYPSKVKIEGSISSGEGAKIVSIKAENDIITITS